MNKTVGGKKRSRDKKMRRNISDFKAKRLKEMKNTKKGFEIEMFIPEGSFNRTAHQDLSPEPRIPKVYSDFLQNYKYLNSDIDLFIIKPIKF